RMVAQVREDTFDVVDDEGSTRAYYGATVGYDFSRRWGLSLNYTRHQGEFSGIDVDIDNVTVGGEFRF
ncbi:MAG: porin family protein, partial [Luteimonas sp.]